jgi:5-methylcytosine-specific restriction endonuclease McrA
LAQYFARLGNAWVSSSHGESFGQASPESPQVFTVTLLAVRTITRLSSYGSVGWPLQRPSRRSLAWANWLTGGGHDVRARVSYPNDWDDLRRRVYARDGYGCGNCGAAGVELHAHHIVPLSRGGTNNMTNLTTLCATCHGRLHPHMRDLS